MREYFPQTIELAGQFPWLRGESVAGETKQYTEVRGRERGKGRESVNKASAPNTIRLGRKSSARSSGGDRSTQQDNYGDDLVRMRFQLYTSTKTSMYR